jgi:plasmid stabilization system protein ParE
VVTVWSKRARMELRMAFEYILQDSPQNAVKVRDEIIDTTIKLPEHPEKYPPDKYKKSNNGNWRAFKIYYYRITHRVMQNEIRIVRLRHTSRNPINF